ncbi:hypothetical protein WA026_014850 [Henosepilachna vigintioctopunctata]|uniref:Uncharacterized protein n=1 Tax=Henosepilachna vigintioctopunctata TaxID=420089 RepID=A0AAW1V1V9_9CUCU
MSEIAAFEEAKGSKASNERICEEATSWEEMKQQLVERKKEIEDEGERKKIEQVRNINYQNFLKNKNEQEINKSEWAEFPNSSSVVEKKKSIKHSHETLHENEIDSGVEVVKTSRKKHKKDINNDGNLDNDAPVEISSKIEISMPQIKKSKQKKKKLSIVVEDNADIERVEKVQEVQNEQNKKTGNKMKSGHPNDKKRKSIDMETLTEPEKKKIKKKLERRIKQIEKKKLKKQVKGEESIKVEENEENLLLHQKKNPAHDLSYSSKRHHKSLDEKSIKNEDNLKKNKIGSNTPKKEKLKTGEYKRRKSFQPDKVMINGKEVIQYNRDNVNRKKPALFTE